MLNLTQSLLRYSGACALLAASVLAAGPASAAAWTESGDAGQTLGSAQVIANNVPTPLTSINGSFSDFHDVDLFKIYISNAAAFSATTVGGNLMDTQLFLFTLSGQAVYTNDDDANYASDGANFLFSTLPAGSALGPASAGYYLLGIALSGNDPVNAVNDLLFASGLTTDVRGPAGSLSPKTLADFTGGTFFDERGGYTIQLTGAEMTIPEPTTTALALLAFGLCGVASSRRGRRTVASANAAA